MKRKISPAHLNVVGLFQFLYTPGTDIAPGSNKISVDLKFKRLQRLHSGIGIQIILLEHPPLWLTGNDRFFSISRLAWKKLFDNPLGAPRKESQPTGFVHR